MYRENKRKEALGINLIKDRLQQLSIFTRLDSRFNDHARNKVAEALLKWRLGEKYNRIVKHWATALGIKVQG